MNKRALGRRIAELRNKQGMTQRDLAAQTQGKISPTRLSNYEQGTREPGLAEIVTLAQALRTTPGFLAGFTRLEQPLSNDELDTVRALRILPDNERHEYVRRIKALSMVYQNPVLDERIKIPSPPDQPPPKLGTKSEKAN